MIDFNILLEKECSNLLIKNAIILFFDEFLNEDEILICKKLPEYVLPDNIKLLIIKNKVMGDFSTLLEFWFRIEVGISDQSGFSFIKFLSKNTNMKILFPDEGVDPYVSILINGDNSILVDLDPEKYDDYIYVISNQRGVINK